MVLDLQQKTIIDFESFSQLFLGLENVVFAYEDNGDTSLYSIIRVLEGQELKIITNNLFLTLDLSHLKIILEKDSKLTITERNNLQLKETLEVEQKENSTFVYQKLYQSSGNSCLYLTQNGESCKAEIQNIVVGYNTVLEINQKITQDGREQILDHKTKFILSGDSNLIVSHFGKSSTTSTDCIINQKIKGVILDSNSKVEMQPILEIDSDSSTSNHGASVGEFDRNEIQYLHTRGLHPSKIQKILIDSFLNNFYDKIEPICVREGWWIK
jgi:Fe-S cluster assembly scaffold protein SufB